MEITARQFGQIEAACSALEEATEKNNTALRLVSVIKENLAEIAKTYCPLEIVIEFEEPELPLAQECSGHLTSENTPADPRADIRAYGQELINQGITMKELIKMVMEHFGLTQDAFAHLIKVNQGSLSKYLRNGERKDAVITGITDFFGEDCGTAKGDNQ